MLPDAQSLAGEAFAFLRVAAFDVDGRQVVRRARHLETVGPQLLPPDSDRLLEQACRLVGTGRA